MPTWSGEIFLTVALSAAAYGWCRMALAGWRRLREAMRRRAV